MTSRARRTATLWTVWTAVVVSASLPGAARAEFPGTAKFYGFVNAEVERVWARGGATPYDPRFRVTDGNSRLGFSGTIDVTEQTRALWQIEAGLNSFEQGGTNDKGVLGAISSRNTFVGIADDRFGTLRVGYVDSVYRSLVGSGSELGGNLGLTSFGLDLWNNTSGQLSGNPWSVFSRGEARLKNSVHYLSPDWIVRAGASYGIDETTSTRRGRDRLSVAAQLKWQGLQAGLGYDLQRNTGLDTDGMERGLGAHTDAVEDASTRYLKAVAGYRLAGTYVGIGWERASYGYARFVPATASDPDSSVRTGTLTQDAIMVSFAQELWGVSLMVSGGKLFALKGASAFVRRDVDYGALQYSVGAKYPLNEHFAVYAHYTAIRNAPLQDVNLGQGPLYSNGLGTSAAFLAPGDDPNAFGLGLIARF